MTDFSKAFDCLSHDLFIAMTQTYGFDTRVLRLRKDYLSNRMERSKVGQVHSSWKEIKYGIPQGSILSPLFFNIDLCDLFFIMKEVDIVSSADDNTPFMSANNITNLIEDLEDSARSIIKWLANNEIQGNATICHVLLNTNEKVITKVDSAQIKNSQSSKLRSPYW